MDQLTNEQFALLEANKFHVSRKLIKDTPNDVVETAKKFLGVLQETDKEDSDKENSEPVFVEADGIYLQITCHAVPFQIEGYAYGYHVYFRERNNQWRFYMSKDRETLMYDYNIKAEANINNDITPSKGIALVRTLIEIYK